jgi:hypothetical protein
MHFLLRSLQIHARSCPARRMRRKLYDVELVHVNKCRRSLLHLLTDNSDHTWENRQCGNRQARINKSTRQI